MEIRRLSYFVRIAEDGSLTKAAGVLRIAQPALSRQIRLLEEELGVPLFKRAARGMQLTEEGEYLRASVAGPLRAMELALQSVRSFSPRIEGNFTIGMPSSIGAVLSRPLVLRMHADYPNIRLRVVEGITGSLVDWLHRGILDFAIIEEASRDERLKDQVLFSERLMLIGEAGSDLKAERPIPFSEAIRLPLILPTHHLGIRGAIDEALSKLRTGADIRFEADSSKLVRELVEAGLGYSILPLSYFREAFEAGTLRYCPIVDPVFTLTTYLSYRANEQAATSKLEGMVIDSIAQMMKELRFGAEN